MYFPYLRGKQFELLALREIAPRLGSSGRVMPIIEPVRAPADSGLDRCLTSLVNYSVGFVLVVNPNVGELQSRTIPGVLAEYIADRDQEESWNIGVIIEEGTDVGSLLQSYIEAVGTGRTLTLIHKSLAVSGENVPAVENGFRRGFDVVSDDIKSRHLRSLTSKADRGVTLHDGFVPEKRNANYIGRQETTFNEDHLYYKDEGWFGFGDYLTIGAEFSEGGFSPRAVAIHWTYEPAVGKPIMIRSFTSESNGDVSNVGGKFLEAAGKLVAFLNAHNIQTDAANIMRSHVFNHTYPGLGVVKKLSILNHLQMMSEILSR
ncbi:sce7725 family protein [Jatrophihabitans sp.]|uniref:sce7725 family protein n=1 Tax=Jatrophihabitans sp. TaxID=1932789 RepID=UPI002CA76137|nr:sce7725 family protein [Jatrophihabitans sp.]